MSNLVPTKIASLHLSVLETCQKIPSKVAFQPSEIHPGDLVVPLQNSINTYVTLRDTLRIHQLNTQSDLFVVPQSISQKNQTFFECQWHMTLKNDHVSTLPALSVEVKLWDLETGEVSQSLDCCLADGLDDSRWFSVTLGNEDLQSFPILEQKGRNSVNRRSWKDLEVIFSDHPGQNWIVGPGQHHLTQCLDVDWDNDLVLTGSFESWYVQIWAPKVSLARWWKRGTNLFFHH